MIELPLMRFETKAKVSQAFPLTKLAENHTKHLPPTGEASYAFIPTELLYTLLELILGKETDNLSENILAFMHFEQVRSRSLTIAKSS